MGTPLPAAKALERLLDDGHEVPAVYTQPDRPAGRGNKIVFSPVKILALDRGIPVLQPEKIRTRQALRQFREFEADAAAVVAFGRLLPEGFLGAFPHGCVNLHFSLLPSYRGAAPVNWAIVNGESETGVTSMKMDAGLDTGDILLQRATDIGPDENAVELMDRLADLGADVLSETLATIDSITPRPQDDSAATLAPLMTKEDGRIDWSLTPIEIARRVRGFQPFPSSYTFLGSKRVTIFRARPSEALAVPGPTAHPGTVIAADANGLVVACGGGSLLIEELQIEGKRRMAARDVINGGSVKAGMTFHPTPHAE